MNILIVGYTGFIGQNLIDYYLKIKNVTLFLVSRKIIEKNKANKRVKYISSNTNDLKLFFQNKQNKIDVIIFCASVVDSKKNTYKDYYNGNVIYLKKFLRLINKNIVKNFIYLSTINIYGKKINYLKEEKKPDPQNTYAKTKLLAEKIIQNELTNKIDYLILRLPLVYGKKKLKGSLFIIKKIIQITPFFVSIKFRNKKSMLGIKNLADFILFVDKKKKYFSNLRCKIFNISDRDNYSTDDVFFFFSKIYKKNFFYITMLNNVARLILNFFSKRLFEKYFGSYTIDTTKIKKTGWKASYKFIDHF